MDSLKVDSRSAQLHSRPKLQPSGRDAQEQLGQLGGGSRPAVRDGFGVRRHSPTAAHTPSADHSILAEADRTDARARVLQALQHGHPVRKWLHLSEKAGRGSRQDVRADMTEDRAPKREMGSR
jgi:hypothetical protein